MKTSVRVPALLLSLLVLAVAAGAPPALRAEPPTSADLTGSTWELVAHKYGEADDWENAASTERKLKILTGTHFVWISYQADSGEVRGTGGGTYTLSGATYTEVVEFGNTNVSALRGKDHVFTLDLKGDRLEQTGKLSTGLKIAEVWQRVR